MKKLILIAGTALLLAGCNQGGTSDEYGTSGGNASSTNSNISNPGATNSGSSVNSPNANP